MEVVTSNDILSIENMIDDGTNDSDSQSNAKVANDGKRRQRMKQRKAGPMEIPYPYHK